MTIQISSYFPPARGNVYCTAQDGFEQVIKSYRVTRDNTQEKLWLRSSVWLRGLREDSNIWFWRVMFIVNWINALSFWIPKTQLFRLLTAGEMLIHMKAEKGLSQSLVLRALTRFILRFSPSSSRREYRSSKNNQASHLRYFSVRGFLITPWT